MKKKVLLIFTFLLLAVCLYTTAYAHSGRTDSNGGHYDRETGEYHYHHGYPAHDHDGGICPYNYDDRTGWNSGTTGDGSKDNQSKGQKNIPKKTESNNSKLLPFILLLTPFAILLLFLLWSFIYGYVDSRKFAKEQAKYSQLYEGKRISEIISIPNYAIVGSDGLPKDRDATTYWGKHFTVYCSATGKRAHRKKGCSNAYIAKNIVNAPYYTCSRCYKEEKESLDWFFEYRRIKRLAHTYKIPITDDLQEDTTNEQIK